MRATLLQGIIFTALLFGGFSWLASTVVCPTPIEYQLGTLDASFNIGETEALDAILEAEAIWEDAVGTELFVLREGVGLPINFVFDERQQFTNTADDATESLDAAKLRNETLDVQYQALVDRYETLQAAYNTAAAAFQERLAAYNAEVAKWNEEGGAPQEVFAELQQTEDALNEEQAALDEQALQLRALVDELNALSSDANESIDAYNEQVRDFNDTYTEVTEFTQGDYRGDSINIYQFGNREELVLVLAHELGHALGIDHVANEASIMFMRMEAQETAVGLSPEDMAGYALACGDGSLWFKLKKLFAW